MKRFSLALLLSLLALAGCGGGSTPHHQLHPSVVSGPSAHSPTFGLPPIGVAPPRRLAPTAVPTLEMFDSVTLSTVPSTARVVAGYTAGAWPTYPSLVRAFPRAHHVSIAVGARYAARCLDIEPGDATVSQATGWYRFARRRGVARPCFYANLSTMPLVRANLANHGIGRSRVLLWDADWTYEAHLDAGYDATQWTNHSLGRNLDESTVTLTFAGVEKPKPKPRPRPKATHAQARAELATLNRLLGAYGRRDRRGHNCQRPPYRHAYPSAHYNHACSVWAARARADRRILR